MVSLEEVVDAIATGLVAITPLTVFSVDPTEVTEHPVNGLVIDIWHNYDLVRIVLDGSNPIISRAFARAVEMFEETGMSLR